MKTLEEKRETHRLKQQLYRQSVHGKAVIALYNESHRIKKLSYEAKRAQTQQGRYRKYINNAKHRNITFELPFEEFITYWQQPCFYCGQDIKTIGLDRLDNAKGYVRGNLASCCPICNKMKSIFPLRQFIDKCKEISNKFAG